MAESSTQHLGRGGNREGEAERGHPHGWGEVSQGIGHMQSAWFCASNFPGPDPSRSIEWLELYPGKVTCCLIWAGYIGFKLGCILILPGSLYGKLMDSTTNYCNPEQDSLAHRNESTAFVWVALAARVRLVPSLQQLNMISRTLEDWRFLFLCMYFSRG